MIIIIMIMIKLYLILDNPVIICSKYKFEDV